MDGYALETRGLTKSYFGNRVVSDVSMRLQPGEIYGLVGKNGAGKSTFMKLVCGVVRPTSGSIAILGRDMRPGATYSKMGSLIEHPGLFPRLTAFGNVMCRALALGLADPPEQARLVLALVGLDPSSREKAGTLSLGHRQRLGLAIALVGTPDLLVLDEPFNGIDIEGTRCLRSIIVDAAVDRNIAVLVSSHIIDQLERFATRYGVIRDGHLVREVTSEQVAADCATGLSVRTAEPERALAVLSEAFPRASATQMRDGELRMPAECPVDEVVRSLVAAHVPVESVGVVEGDVEKYFSDLMSA